MATVPASASTLTAMGATRLKMRGYDKQLATESVLFDCFQTLSGKVVADNKGVTIPNAIFLKCNQPTDGTHEMTLALLKDFQEKAYMGNAEAILGNEENIRMKHMTIYYNEIKKSAAQFGWGIDFNDLKAYDPYARITEMFTRFFAELRGRRIREALLLTYAEELTKSPISLKQRFTPNIFMANTNLGSMPGYPAGGWNGWDANLTVTTPTYPTGVTYGEGATDNVIESIGDAYSAATSGFTAFQDAVFNVDDLARLEYYVQHDLMMDPIMMDSQPSYIFTVPASTASYLMNPTVSKSLGEIWKDTAALKGTEAAKIPNVLGSYGSLVMVKDSRNPTITLGGANGAWTAQVGFQQPGRRDGRNHATPTDSNKVMDVGFVIGAGALVEWTVSQLKYATESTEYGQLLGKGAHTCAGIQMAVYDQDTLADGSYQQNSSCAVLMSPPVL